MGIAVELKLQHDEKRCRGVEGALKGAKSDYDHSLILRARIVYRNDLIYEAASMPAGNNTGNTLIYKFTFCRVCMHLGHAYDSVTVTRQSTDSF